ncbi:MAG: baeRF10 domain-containing protein [Candidatus Saccharicenans sp.]|uniref:baeRF10 domain-containing protein n=1 Tax=Candidatus Saccharicenans sp. TaxID=2819258 RepID=UPI00404B02EA
MKFTSPSQAEALAQMKTHPYQATSFYLNTDKSQQPLKAINAAYKGLLNQARLELEGKELSREARKSLLDDLEKISQFCTNRLNSWKAPGLAIFCCSARNIWQELELPHGPRNRLIQDFDFYARPLTAILEKFKKLCAFLLNRREAYWYEIHMAEIRLLDSLTSDVPKKVKKGGFEGYESKRIERHIDALLMEHFKKATQKTFDILKQNHFDWLLVGCDDQFYPQLEPLFHSYVKGKLKGRLKARPGTEASRVLEECLTLEEKLKREEEETLVKKFTAELERGGRAVSGLADTLRKLNSFEIQHLLITHNFSKPGKVCPSCHGLFRNEEICPACKVKIEAVADIVDEAIEVALRRNIPVTQVSPPSRLEHYGSIGAFLKYKP